MTDFAMSSKRTRSCLALVQFVAILQIFVGWVVLPSEMHLGDSASEAVIMSAAKDERLRETIMQWHDHDVSITMRWIVSLGVIQLTLSSLAVFVVNRDVVATENNSDPIR